MSAPILPPPPTAPATKRPLRVWCWHPRADVGPTIVSVLRVLEGRGIVVIKNDSGSGPPEIGIPVQWLFCPPDSEGVNP